ncbi:hypothetical protein F3Y22_tig00110328pilonHSYRG00066 [Hibiscus syriacus]|uniref:Protein SHOOT GRAVITROPISM 5 n=1 Tax=Hibiscus syriacus TaxID=106335 RepID=A0A6A3B2Q3_HIBSY|nr:hypothetical protein F3Y22_tig00110328pilonHSYRG00066 [Hibiscus syriacus]
MLIITTREKEDLQEHQIQMQKWFLFRQRHYWNRIVMLRDLQPRVPEGPKPTDAPAATQGSLEIAEERDSGGDLVGIKKHFRRKHSNHKQWVCQKCSKGYAVQSDYKAHLKTCGTRGHSCDCGRVFSRVESFIEHQDACNIQSGSQEVQPVCLSRTASSPSPSSEIMFFNPTIHNNSSKNVHYHNLDLQLLTTSREPSVPHSSTDDKHSTQLQLSIGSSDIGEKNGPTVTCANKNIDAEEQLKLAVADKAYATEARRQAKRLVELAEQEFAKAKRLRQQAQAELEKAQALRDHATKQINNSILQITCHACKHQLQETSTTPDENSLVVSYISSAITGTG